MEITKQDVERFLANFHTKMQVFNIVFRDDRKKNADALAELDIKGKYRETVIMGLEYWDYVDGPIVDTLNQLGDMWVFGKDVKGREVYIKISIGRPGSNTICISFHIAEFPLVYPFKDD